MHAPPLADRDQQQSHDPGPPTQHGQTAHRRDHPSKIQPAPPNWPVQSSSRPSPVVSAGRYRRLLCRGVPGPVWGCTCPLSLPRTARDLRTPPLPPRRHLRQRPQPPHQAAHRTARCDCPTHNRAAPTGTRCCADNLRPPALPLRRDPRARAPSVHPPTHRRRGSGHRRRRSGAAPGIAGPGRRAGNHYEGTGQHDTVAIGIDSSHSPPIALFGKHSSRLTGSTQRAHFRGLGQACRPGPRCPRRPICAFVRRCGQPRTYLPN